MTSPCSASARTRSSSSARLGVHHRPDWGANDGPGHVTNPLGLLEKRDKFA